MKPGTAYFRKIFSTRNTSLFLLAAPVSGSLKGLLNILVEDTSLKGLLLPLLVAAVSLSLYFVVFLLDFISGVRASRHEAADKNNYFSSARGWSSMWKIATVSVLVTARKPALLPRLLHARRRNHRHYGHPARYLFHWRKPETAHRKESPVLRLARESDEGDQ